jgi:outer membrane protein assembly factor BamB
MIHCGFRAIHVKLKAVLLLPKAAWFFVALALLCTLPESSLAAQSEPVLLWAHPATDGQHVNAYIGSMAGIYVQDSALGIFHYAPDGTLLWQYPDLTWNIRQIALEFPGLTVLQDTGGHCWAINSEGELAWEFLPRPWDYLDYPPGDNAAAADFYAISGDLSYALNTAGQLCWVLHHPDAYRTYVSSQIDACPMNETLLLLRSLEHGLLPYDRQGRLLATPGLEGLRFPSQAALLADCKLVLYGDEGMLQLLSADFQLLQEFDDEPENYMKSSFHVFSMPGAAAGWTGRSSGKTSRVYDTDMNLLWTLQSETESIRELQQFGDQLIALVQRPPESFATADEFREQLGEHYRMPAGDNTFEITYSTWLVAYSEGELAWERQIFPWVIHDKFQMLPVDASHSIIWEFDSGVWCYEVPQT